jgi:hypothetical protein
VFISAKTTSPASPLARGLSRGGDRQIVSLYRFRAKAVAARRCVLDADPSNATASQISACVLGRGSPVSVRREGVRHPCQARERAPRGVDRVEVPMRLPAVQDEA